MKSIKPQAKKSGPIKYFQKGDNPELLIHSGSHGDEWRVIQPLTNFILNNSNQLPDFIFVPEVSPSAIKKKTRRNKNNIDINRNFFDHSSDLEVVHNLQLIKKHNFNLCLSFHEDPEYSEFYLYDSGQINDKYWQTFVSLLNKTGLETLNGIDDPEDKDLGFTFVNGYFSFNHLEPNGDSGSMSDYLLSKQKTKRFIIPEVPSNSSQLQKEQIIELVFSELLNNI